MSNRVELHLHSHYSLMDGLNSPEEYVKVAKEFGMPAMALTDHGTLSGHRDFQIACKEHGVKPLLGVEAYISATGRFDRRPVTKREDNTQLYNHIQLIAKDQDGLRNLHAASLEAWTSGYYHKPRMDFELLTEHHEGIVALSGCMNGLIPKAFERGEVEEAYAIASKYKELFGEDFYIEVQSHNPLELNEFLLKLADELGIKPVATTDCHFTRPELRWVEEAMLILATKPNAKKEADYEATKHIKDTFERFNAMYPERPISFEEIDVFLMNYQEISDRFKANGIDREDIHENTLAIAESVGDYDFVEGRDLLPRISKTPDGDLEAKVLKGLKRLGLNEDDKYTARAKEELRIIKDKNFSTYFLIVGDIVDWAWDNGIIVGPGRGSAVSSLVCYSLGITAVDPLKYNLLFSRFVDPEREDFPDIDLDFPRKRRGEVKEYITKKYGHVASISNFIYFSEKGVIRDAARVYRVPVKEVDEAMKYVEGYDDFITSHETKKFRDKYPEVLPLAEKLRGRIRSVGMHAAGVVTSSEPIENFAPIETRSDPNADDKKSGRVQAVAWDMKQCEAAGFIKLDALGLKTLDVIDAVAESTGLNPRELYDMDLDDPGVYEMISAGHTRGVFQADAVAYTNLLVEMGVENFEDLVASNALVRPGAMDSIGKSYIKRKKGQETVEHFHEITENILADSYGLPVYQEDVMRIAMDLGGMTGGESNRLRKIIGKKRDVEEFKPFHDKFIKEATRYISEEKAEEIWSDFEKHANYSFNRSHAVAYSLLTYITAWLKLYYPSEFMAALLRTEKDKDDRVDVILEIRRLGKELLLPDITRSSAEATVTENGILLGLSDIKYISDKVTNRIERIGPFSGLKDFYEKAQTKGSGVNSRAQKALEITGALRNIGGSSGERESFYEYLGIPIFKNTLPEEARETVTPLSDLEDKGVFLIKGMAKSVKRGNKNGRDWVRYDILDETGTGGIFNDSHDKIILGNMYVFLVANNSIIRAVPVDDFTEKPDDPFVQIIMGKRPPKGRVIVVGASTRFTKKKQRMATAILMNADGNMIRGMAFPRSFGKFGHLLKAGREFTVKVKPLDAGEYMITEAIP